MRCSSPRSPLGPDTSATPATGTPSSTPAATASPGVTVTATPPAGDGTPVAADRELAIGMAIERMALWLGVEQTALVFSAFEETTFPNACLGVERPGIACAEVLTPGVRVTLLDRVSASHEVRADATLQSFAWAPEATATGNVVAVDRSAGTLTVDAEGAELRLRTAPGTLQDTPLADLAAGDAVTVGFDRSPADGQPGVLVWISG